MRCGEVLVKEWEGEEAQLRMLAMHCVVFFGISVLILFGSLLVPQRE